MRRTLTVCRTGLSVAAVVVLLAACGGGSDTKSSAASGSTTAGSSSAPSSAAHPSKFCVDATTTLNGLSPAFSSNAASPSSLAPVLKKAATQVRAIQPPAEIRTDWAQLADGLDQFASAYASVNVNDPASASAFQQQNSALLAKLTTAVTHVQAYMVKNCGLAAQTSTPAAPTS
ncbi:MAG: hypothetical protein ACXVFZ_06230 [Blastococcus sp.]